MRSYQHSEKHIVEPAHQPPASRALSRPRGARRSGQLATATSSSPLRSPRYGSQEDEHKPFKDALQKAPSRTRWLVMSDERVSRMSHLYPTYTVLRVRC